jgi:WD40 repeat protein
MRILKGPRAAVREIVFSPDGRLLAVGHHDRLNVWDTTTGTITLTGEPTGYCDEFAFSPDGRYLATLVSNPENTRRGLGADLTVWALDRPQDPLVQRTGHRAPLWFHPDESWLLAWCYGIPPVRWDLPDGTCRDAWTAPRQTVSYYLHGGWRVAPRGDRLHRIEHLKEAGNWFYHIELVHPATGQVMRKVKSSPRFWHWDTARVLPDDRHLVAFAGSLVIVEDIVEDRTVLRRRGGRKGIDLVAIAPDGSRVITTPGNKEVQVWTPPDWPEPQAYSWPIGRVTCLAIAPDGQRAAAGGSSGQVIIWDLDA